MKYKLMSNEALIRKTKQTSHLGPSTQQGPRQCSLFTWIEFSTWTTIFFPKLDKNMKENGIEKKSTKLYPFFRSSTLNNKSILVIIYSFIFSFFVSSKHTYFILPTKQILLLKQTQHNSLHFISSFYSQCNQT